MNDLSRELSKKNEGLQPKALPKKIPAHYPLDSLIPSLRIPPTSPPTPNLIRSPHAPITLCKAKTEFLGPVLHFPDLAHVHFTGSASQPEPLLDESWHHFTSFKPPSPGSGPAGLGASSICIKGARSAALRSRRAPSPHPPPQVL